MPRLSRPSEAFLPLFDFTLYSSGRSKIPNFEEEEEEEPRPPPQPPLTHHLELFGGEKRGRKKVFLLLASILVESASPPGQAREEGGRDASLSPFSTFFSPSAASNDC